MFMPIGFTNYLKKKPTQTNKPSGVSIFSWVHFVTNGQTIATVHDFTLLYVN